VKQYLSVESDASITELLISWREGNPAALEDLTPQIHRELHAIAQSYLRRGRPNQTLQSTALVNEAWLRLIGQTQLPQWESRAHQALKRGGDAEEVSLDDARLPSPARAPEVLEVHKALDELAKVDERKAKVIELRYFGGMEREEVATDLRLGGTWLRRFLAGGSQP
jgi:DNA-directed RNA polymerase specialized sigma subunit